VRPRGALRVESHTVLIPFATLAVLLWLRHVEVKRFNNGPSPLTAKCRPSNSTNQNGQPFGSAQLTGKIWIGRFHLHDLSWPVPMISTRMGELQKPLRNRRYLVSFSVDPGKDTPTCCVNTRIISTPIQSAGLSYGNEIVDLQTVGTTDSSSRFPNRSEAEGMPVHSTRMVLVDRHGEIRGYYDAIGPDAITELDRRHEHLLRDNASNRAQALREQTLNAQRSTSNAQRSIQKGLSVKC